MGIEVAEPHIGHVPQHPQQDGEQQAGDCQQSQEDAFLGPQGIAAVQDFDRFLHLAAPQSKTCLSKGWPRRNSGAVRRLCPASCSSCTDTLPWPQAISSPLELSPKTVPGAAAPPADFFTLAANSFKTSPRHRA